MVESKKYIIAILIIYVLIGYAYNLYGEYNLAIKYDGLQNKEFNRSAWIVDPYVHLRSIIFAPFWPLYMSATLYHYGTIF